MRNNLSGWTLQVLGCPSKKEKDPKVSYSLILNNLEQKNAPGWTLDIGHLPDISKRYLWDVQGGEMSKVKM